MPPPDPSAAASGEFTARTENATRGNLRGVSNDSELSVRAPNKSPWVLRAYVPADRWDGEDCDCISDPVGNATRIHVVAGWLHQESCPVTDKAKGWG